MIIIINIFLTLILITLLGIVIWNMYVFRNRKYEDLIDYPSVSVLVPARNEERNIRNCIVSLAEQNYTDFEIVVLDDNSEDNTLSILYELKEKYKNIKIVSGKSLPEGWAGKNFACHQLYLESKGKYLLFTDADTIHKKDSIKNAVTRAVTRSADLYTLIPEMTLKSFAEKSIMPALHFTTFTLLPYYMVESSPFSVFAMGVGPFMLFKREAYEKIGGHLAVKSDLVEDVRLSKNIKKNKLKVIVNKGIDVFSCRMYTNYSEIWNGFSKNIYPGMNYSTLTLFFVLFLYTTLFLSPFVIAILSFVFNSNIILFNSLIQIGLILFMRIIINYNFKLGWISILTHPFSIIVISLIGMNSYRWNKFGNGSKWKGRTYSIQNSNNEISNKLIKGEV